MTNEERNALIATLTDKLEKGVAFAAPECHRLQYAKAIDGAYARGGDELRRTSRGLAARLKAWRVGHAARLEVEAFDVPELDELVAQLEKLGGVT